jgi:hypothetical protein
MLPLNFPPYEYRTKIEGKRIQIFDSIRKKYIALTPEEWVRQHLINYLVTEKGYPASLISVETPLIYAHLNKRSDILVNNHNGQPLMLIECKAPEVPVSQKTFEQIAIYNLTIKASYMMVTNGLQHYCMIAATESSQIQFLNVIPDYGELRVIS